MGFHMPPLRGWGGDGLPVLIRCRRKAGPSTSLASLRSGRDDRVFFEQKSLVDDFVVFGGGVAAKELGQILRESGARQHHVAADFVGFLL